MMQPSAPSNQVCSIYEHYSTMECSTLDIIERHDTESHQMRLFVQSEVESRNFGEVSRVLHLAGNSINIPSHLQISWTITGPKDDSLTFTRQALDFTGLFVFTEGEGVTARNFHQAAGELACFSIKKFTEL